MLPPLVLIESFSHLDCPSGIGLFLNTTIHHWFVRASAFLLAACASNSPVAVETDTIVREFIQSDQQANYNQLLEEFGANKELPPGYELQALLALSFYPELKDTKIKFIAKDVDIPISSRPLWNSMLNHAKNRTYLVVIDTEREGREALLLKNQPFNAQIGILGHELAHTVYYLDRSFFGIASDALCQLSGCRIDFERETDKRLIEYGLGWQRFDHAMFLRTSLTGDTEVALNTQGGGGAYMSPGEMLQLMEDSGSYTDIEAELAQ